MSRDVVRRMVRDGVVVVVVVGRAEVVGRMRRGGVERSGQWTGIGSRSTLA